KVKTKSENRKMKEKVTVRFDDETHKFIEQEAQRMGVSKADYIRTVVLMNQSKQSKVKRLSRDEANKLLNELVRITNECNAVQIELKRIGNNINQVVKIAHQNKRNWSEWEHETISLLNDFGGEIDRYLNEKWSLFEKNR
uniref:plasmid mobilization protein n=1 Tax=Streptococcus suis TaxID=1307 RepID=UPI00370384C2